MTRLFVIAVAALSLAAPVVGQAQPAAEAAQPLDPDTIEANDQVRPTPPLPRCASGVVPPLTPIAIEVLDTVGSKVSKSGQTFRFRLAAPINLGECEAIPAGTLGMAEVVHAKKALGSGAPGEFIAAARYLQIGERRLALRSFKMTETGGDNLEYNRLSQSLGIFTGLFAKRDPKDPNVLVKPGTVVTAKTAEAFDLAGGPT